MLTQRYSASGSFDLSVRGTLAAADLLQAALERGEQIRHRLRRLGLGRHLDGLPLALPLDDLEQPLAVAVLVARGVEVTAELLDQRDGVAQLLGLGRVALPGQVEVVGRA